MKVFVLTQKVGVCHGHGENADHETLVGPGWYGNGPVFYPCFTNRPAAETFIKQQKNLFGVHIVELDVQQ